VARLPLRAAFEAIDWTRPWLAPYRAHGEAACAAVLQGASVAQALNAVLLRQPQPLWLAVGPLRFVPQAALPAGEAYESFIFRTASVPTRDHLHDFFNGLVWLAEPALKRRLNELHAQVLAEEGVRPRRSPRRDVLTLADESGALLQAPPDAVELLRRRGWRELLVAQRALAAGRRRPAAPDRPCADGTAGAALQGHHGPCLARRRGAGAGGGAAGAAAAALPAAAGAGCARLVGAQRAARLLRGRGGVQAAAAPLAGRLGTAAARDFGAVAARDRRGEDHSVGRKPSMER
jgi:hypothetical protein